MKRLVVFCGSYPQIKNTLYVVTRMHPDVSATIIVLANHDLFRFFEVINEKAFHNKLDVLYLKTYQTRRAKANRLIQRVFYLPLDIIGEKRYLKLIYDTCFGGLKGARVFFSSRCFCSYTWYLLNKLKRVNTLVHIPDPSCDALAIDRSKPKDIFELAWLAVMKLTFGYGITVGRLSYTKFTCIPNRFMEKEVDKAFSIEERNEMMKDFDLDKFDVFDAGSYKVLYFDQPIAGTGCVDNYDTYKVELAAIFAILRKYFSEHEIAIKYHPHYVTDRTMMELGVVLEDFIPAEFLYNDNIKMYLGLSSIALANVKKGLVVSIADLISLANDERSKQLKETLILRSRSQILFPESLEEFERIVAGVSGVKGATADRG
ncbi:MAG: hypothetical protein PHI12_00080 [Dehalococcoidales bacterium]|nr:hypothetical protein [Dehalococcoidales bacterium]